MFCLVAIKAAYIMGHHRNMYLVLKTKLAHGTEGGDSLGISEQLETPQERTRRGGSRFAPRKASACSGMCCQVQILVKSLS